MRSNVQKVDFGNRKHLHEGSGGQVATLDEGYFRVASSIGKLKPKLKLAGREHQVFDAVIFCTFGWNKSEDKVTNTYIADMTELDDSDVADALKALAERRVINLRKVGGFKLVSVNVNLNQWVLNKPVRKTVKTPPKELGETAHNGGRKEVSEWAKSPDTLNSLTIDNLTTINPPIVPQEKAAKQPAKSKPKSSLQEIPEWLSRDTWDTWLAYRGEIGKAIKSPRTITMAINVLRDSLELGYQPEEIINQSIANGWTGIFVPKQPARKKGVAQPAKPMAHIPEGFQ